MDRPYLQDLRVRNYGCIQDASLTLSPLHALIGPNDSGKTTILRAIKTVAFVLSFRPMDREALLYSTLMRNCESADSVFFGSTSPSARERATVGISPLDLGISMPRSKASLEITFLRKAGGDCKYRTFWIDGSAPPGWLPGHWRSRGSLHTMAEINEILRNCTLLRLGPDALRTPHKLLQDGVPITFQDERGLGLPAIYDAIQNRDIDAFLALNAELVRLFPDIKSIRLTNPTNDTKSVGVNLVDGTFVPSESMSEGMLYYLAFAALRYIDQPAILLIEEPENGLHPARIVEVMRVLRELSKTTQIILATHSPLVVNELEPHEVSVITRNRDTGTRATLMKDTANFEERSKVYALGELWLSYANGMDEAPLISGVPRP